MARTWLENKRWSYYCKVDKTWKSVVTDTPLFPASKGDITLSLLAVLCDDECNRNELECCFDISSISGSYPRGRNELILEYRKTYKAIVQDGYWAIVSR